MRKGAVAINNLINSRIVEVVVDNTTIRLASSNSPAAANFNSVDSNIRPTIIDSRITIEITRISRTLNIRRREEISLLLELILKDRPWSTSQRTLRCLKKVRVAIRSLRRLMQVLLTTSSSVVKSHLCQWLYHSSVQIRHKVSDEIFVKSTSLNQLSCLWTRKNLCARSVCLNTSNQICVSGDRPRVILPPTHAWLE